MNKLLTGSLPVAMLLLGCEWLPPEIVDGLGGPGKPPPSVGEGTHDCNAPASSFVSYETEEELQRLLVGRWQRCRAAEVAGEDVGIEFTADHKWYALTRVDGVVVRQPGPEYPREWRYLPPGEPNLISGVPDPRGQFVITAITDPPTFTSHPRQLRVLLSPRESLYIPLP
jgi:hypothetical protein